MIIDVNTLNYNGFVRAVADMNAGRERYAHVITFGCQQNEADSEKITGMLLAMGYRISESPDRAEVVIFNTCAVREHAEKKALSIIGRLKSQKAQNKELIIGVCGCMAAESKTVEKIKQSYHFVSFTLEPNVLHKIPEIIYTIKTEQKRVFMLGIDSGDIVEGLPVVNKYSHRAYVSIMYGCNNFCSYCIVPYTRGRERSRDANTVVAECRALVTKGTKEITLLGQNVNSYRSDTDFAGLLRRIAMIDGDFIIRFMTSHPKDVSDALIAVMTEFKGKIAPFFHLPLQSGSDGILKKMNRRYNTEHYLGIIKKLKRAIPDIALSTDIIVGFPEETAEDFEDTLRIIEKVRYDNVYSFIYSKRKGTPAALIEDETPKEEINSRMARLLEACKDIALENNKKYEGKTVRVLVDGYSDTPESKIYTARTDTNKLVHFYSDRNCIGEFVNVFIEKSKPFNLEGKIIDREIKLND